MSKTGIFIIAGLVLAGLVYQILGRVPADALNVALGVLCGIGASIPVSLGLLIALTRQRQQSTVQPEWINVEPEPVQVVQQPMPQRIPQIQQPQVQPQFIVIAPPQGQFAPGQFPQAFPMPTGWTNQQYPFMQEHANTVDAREWRIIGEE